MSASENPLAYHTARRANFTMFAQALLTNFRLGHKRLPLEKPSSLPQSGEKIVIEARGKSLSD